MIISVSMLRLFLKIISIAAGLLNLLDLLMGESYVHEL